MFKVNNKDTRTTSLALEWGALKLLMSGNFCFNFLKNTE